MSAWLGRVRALGGAARGGGHAYRVFAGGAAPSLFAAAAVAVAPLLVSAQSRVIATVDTARVTVGDRIALTLSVEHASGTSVDWPDSLDLAPFEVLEVSEGPTRTVGGVSRSSARITLTVFQLGAIEIPSIEVAVVGASGVREPLATEPIAVEVVSVGADESGDIRDIRGPLAMPLELWRVALWALLSLLAVALLFTIARRLRTREGLTPGPALAPPERPAHELALEALAELEASPLLARGEVKEYHIRVSDILRSYLERRFRVDALEMTTSEVLTGLAARGVERDFLDGLRAFLDQCDLVKFAKVRPTPDVCRRVLELGRRLVLQSAPRPEPTAAAGAEDVRDVTVAIAGDGAAERTHGRAAVTEVR